MNIVAALAVGGFQLTLAHFQVENPRAGIKFGCSQGYHVNQSGDCDENQCHCDFGFTSNVCLINNANECGSCLPGYHLVNKQCLKNVCSCEHGTPDANIHEICEVDGANECRVCENGYHLEGETCVANAECICPDEGAHFAD